VSQFDRLIAPLVARLNMMIARGVLRGTSDANGIQTMQVSLMAGEVADSVERFQSYGVSAVPPPGGDALVAFVGGNRDHGVVVAVNDRTSRPKSLRGGEVELYNDQNVSVLLTGDGDLKIRARRIEIVADETIEMTAGESITLKAPAVDINP
jgi:phage baseplate assembly protein V